MRPFVLLCLLAAAQPARAQPVDVALVDSALVDSVVATLHLDQLEPAMAANLRATTLAAGAAPASEQDSAAVDQAASGLAARIGARVRTAIAADYRPALLQAIVTQSRATSQAAVDSAFTAAQDSERITALVRDLTALASDPDAFPLADSALTVRYLRTNGALAPPSDVDRRIMRTVMSRTPGMEDVLRSQGATLDAFVEQTVQQTRAADAARLVPLFRLMIARFTPAERDAFDRTLAFAESDAGRYLAEVISAPVKEETAAFMLEALDVPLAAPRP